MTITHDQLKALHRPARINDTASESALCARRKREQIEAQRALEKELQEVWEDD